MDVLEKAHESGLQLLFSNCSLPLARAIHACGMTEKLGGPFIRMSTEEVYTLLLTALAAMSTTTGGRGREGDMPPLSSTTIAGARNAVQGRWGEVEMGEGRVPLAPPPPVQIKAILPVPSQGSGESGGWRAEEEMST